MIEDKLSVRLYGQPCGILERTAQGKMHFSYNHTISLPLSHAMPLKEKVFDHGLCRSYFGGLLPESETMKIMLAKKYGIDSKDTYSFLAMMGKDCPGAVSFYKVSDPIESNIHPKFENRILNEKEMRKAFSNIRHEPLFFNDFDNYPLLSGTSTKVGVGLVNDKIVLPNKHSVSTHILKIDENEDRLLNHYFCLKAARYAGLIVCDFSLKSVSKQTVLILQRYDRVIEGQSIRQYHQEDLCQALGVRSVWKRECDKGPTFNDLFGLLNRMAIPARERHRMIQAVIFNYLINNTHAHGKNISFLARTPTVWELAPFYDIYCDIECKKQPAMSIGEKTNQADVTDDDWRSFCKQIGYTAPIFKCLLNESCHRILEATAQAFEDFKKEGLGVSLAQKIRQVAKDNVGKMGPLH